MSESQILDRNTDDHQLVLLCAQGDDAAWSEFLRRYGAFLDYIIRRALAAGGRLPDANAVSDVRDDIVAWLLANDGRVLCTYRGESRITSWLGVVVGRRARRIARKGQGLRKRTVSLDALSPEATSHLAVEVGTGTTDARQVALSQLAEALEELSERDRVLLKGAFYDKRSYAELAAEINVRTDSVGQLLYRAKARLKKRLGGDQFLESLSGLLMAWLLWVAEGNGS